MFSKKRENVLKIIQESGIMFPSNTLCFFGEWEECIMAIELWNNEFQETLYDCVVDFYSGYRAKMMDFHAHDYYEISLILSGDLRVFVANRVQEGNGCRLVLAAPKTPHFISRTGDDLYTRINLLFSDEFIADYIPEWSNLSLVFGDGGRVIPLSRADADMLYERIRSIQEENVPFRRRLMTLCLLSVIRESFGEEENGVSEIPHYITQALTYIGEHYNERLVASDIAWRLKIGRTTLMTSFRHYTGSTIGEYILRCRIKAAEKRLRLGENESIVAAACGFSDACALIRAFKKYYGLTPKQYASQKGGSLR